MAAFLTGPTRALMLVRNWRFLSWEICRVLEALVSVAFRLVSGIFYLQ